MVRPIDHGKGWQLVEAPITVTYRRADGTSQTVTHVQQRAARLEDFSTEPAILEQVTTTFNVWAEKLTGPPPAKGDEVILAGGATYHVEVVETCNHGRRWRLGGILERVP